MLIPGVMKKVICLVNFADDTDNIYLNDGSRKVTDYVAAYVSHNL